MAESNDALSTTSSSMTKASAVVNGAAGAGTASAKTVPLSQQQDFVPYVVRVAKLLLSKVTTIHTTIHTTTLFLF